MSPRKMEGEMGGQNGSRLVPIVIGVVEFAIGFFIAGIGSGIIYYFSLLIGGGLCLLGGKSIIFGIFAKQERINEMTLNRISRRR